MYHWVLSHRVNRSSRLQQIVGNHAISTTYQDRLKESLNLCQICYELFGELNSYKTPDMMRIKMHLLPFLASFIILPPPLEEYWLSPLIHFIKTHIHQQLRCLLLYICFTTFHKLFTKIFFFLGGGLMHLSPTRVGSGLQYLQNLCTKQSCIAAPKAAMIEFLWIYLTGSYLLLHGS